MATGVKISTGHAYAGWWNKYHEQHPEIFALQPNGTRINVPNEERFCESNPELWKLVAEAKIKELRAHPDLLAASISENDGGPNEFCTCPVCRSWDSPETQERFKANPNLYYHQESDLISDRVFRFYNEVAKLVQKELPDRYVAGYAYSVYQAAPVRDFPDRADNLIIGYVGFDSEEYLNDTARATQCEDWLKCEQTGEASVSSTESPPAADRPAHHLHPQAGRRPSLHGRPWQVGSDVRKRQRRQLGNPGPELLGVLVKLLWDPHRDVDAIIDDYCRARLMARVPKR